MKVYLLDNCTEELIGCTATELKVLLAMVKICNHNVVDLYRYRDKMEGLLKELSAGSINNAITGLRKKGIIVKTQLPKIWFISPVYFIKGYYQKVYNISRMIEDGISGKMLERMREWEEEEAIEKERASMSRLWDKKREEQKDINVAVGVVEDFTDNIKISY